MHQGFFLNAQLALKQYYYLCETILIITILLLFMIDFRLELTSFFSPENYNQCMDTAQTFSFHISDLQFPILQKSLDQVIYDDNVPIRPGIYDLASKLIRTPWLVTLDAYADGSVLTRILA